MVALTGDLLVKQLFSTYRDIAAEEGRNLELGQDMALGIGFCLAGTQLEAIEKVRPYHDERYKWFAPFGFVRYTDSEGRAWGSPGAPSRVPTIEEGVEQKVWYCGEPEGCVKFLHEIEEKYPGLEDIVLQWPEAMPWEMYKEQLSRFAKDVMPAFTGRG
jgi:hypothetical protein